MRAEYVKLIRDFIGKNPEYLQNLPVLKKDILAIGATEAEFNEALHQLGIGQDGTLPSTSASEKASPQSAPATKKDILNQPGILKKLLEVDIVAHVALVVIVAIPLFLWMLTLVTKQNTAATTMASASTSESHKNTEKDMSLVPKVYATSDAVDATRVFSYPASDITLKITGTPKREVYGFFPYWMIEQEEKVNIDTLTAIGLFGLEVDGKGNIITANAETVDGGWGMWNNPKLDNLVARAKKKRVRVEVTIKAFDRTNIENLVASDDAQKIFISNVIHLMNLKNLDGVNLDFEYLGNADPKVTSGFTRLVTNLRAEMKRQNPDSTLTVDTFISAATFPGFFDVELLSEQTDALILMGYDIHTPKGSPGPVAPLEGPMSILSFLQSYLEKIPPEKIILAVPYYGYDWPLKPDGTPTGDPGRTLPYAELAEVTKGKNILWDATGQTPYYRYIDAETNINRIVYFENVRSLGAKYDLINKKNLKGMGIWALGYDGLNSDLSQLIIEKFAN